MTREEATTKLKWFLESNLIEDISGCEGLKEAIGMAVEALANAPNVLNALDTISRQAAIEAVDSETVGTNPENFKSSEKFIKFMDDADIASFGKWQWANGFNTALVATAIQLKKLPSAQPVIRCKDCKHFGGGTYCYERDDMWDENDFCSYAERREE